ncbi:MAG: sulfite exporter TauE/SafE family protein [Rhabdaerophilum sp.]
MNNGASPVMDDDRSHIATISKERLRLLSALILIALIGLGANWVWNAGSTHAFSWNAFLIALAIGVAAQMVDGALGMAYGLTSNSMLLASGLPPAAATATVHVAEAFTTAASGLSHWRLGNIDKRIFNRLVIPGVVGGVLGAIVITSIDGNALRPWIAAYLLLMGLYIIYRAFKAVTASPNPNRKLYPLAFVGGFADSIGGGGWGPIVTTTMVGSGHEPRTTIGSVNAAEFFVTLASGFSFALLIGINHVESILGLIFGGVLAAPLAARLTGRLDRRLLMVAVGVLISALSVWTISRALGL